MNIREKYNIEETQTTFTVYPKKPSLQMAWLFLAAILGGMLVLLLFKDKFDKVMGYVAYIVMSYFVLRSLYDINIGSKVYYTFDSRNNAVFRTSLFSSKKKIMRLDEVMITVHSEMGSWHYRFGARKSNFVKNYIISESFGSGKKSDMKQADYDDFVLAKIYKLMGAES